MHLNFVSIWVQLHGLPLDYQYLELAERMGQMIGPVEKVDWEDRLPRNIRFMRLKVRLNPWMPVVSGFMLRLDDGTQTWIQCCYERVHKLCTKCGLIGHTSSQCNESFDVERMLIRQRQRIQRLYQVPFAYDPLEPHFHSKLRAYFNKRRNWTNRATFEFMDTKQTSQDHPVPTSVTHATNIPPVSTPNQSTPVSHAPQSSPSPLDLVHATLNTAIHSLSLNRGSVPTTPVNTPISPPPNPPPNPQMLPPRDISPVSNPPIDMSNSQGGQTNGTIRWTWVNEAGPFMTNGELREISEASSAIVSESDTVVMFNLDRLNENRPN